MADKLNLLFGVLDLTSLIAYLLVRLQPLLFIVLALALVHIAIISMRKSPKTERVAVYASSLSSEYAKSGAILHSIESASSKTGVGDFSHLIQRYMLGDGLLTQRAAPGHNTESDSLSSLLVFGIRTGRSVSAGMADFKRRLEKETGVARIMRSKAGAMLSVTYLGIVLFVPLFGGISANVLSSLSSGNTGALQVQTLEISILGYVFLALLITSYAYGRAKSFANSAISLLPLLSVSSFVLFFTSGYFSNLI